MIEVVSTVYSLATAAKVNQAGFTVVLLAAHAIVIDIRLASTEKEVVRGFCSDMQWLHWSTKLKSALPEKRVVKKVPLEIIGAAAKVVDLAASAVVVDAAAAKVK